LEKLLIIVLAGITVFFVILYFTVLRSERKISISHYWKSDKTKIPIGEDIREEFQKNELKIKTFKQLLAIVVSTRNNTHKSLNELQIISHQVSKKSPINMDDLELLKNTDLENQTLLNNLIQLKEDGDRFFSEECTKITDALTKNMNNQAIYINKILKASQSSLKNPEFVSLQVQAMEANYKDLVENHSQLIKQYQSNFSETKG